MEPLPYPRAIAGNIMTIIATIGLIANIIATWLPHRGSKKSMNLCAAYLHLFSDAISSIGVILSGLAIMFPDVYWIDPLLTVLIGLYVLKESIQILWRTPGMFMLAAPPKLDMDEVRQAIRDHEGIDDIHHIHLWAVAENDTHFEEHITVEDQLLSKASILRKQLEKLLHDRFDINHTTFQIEAVTDLYGQPSSRLVN